MWRQLYHTYWYRYPHAMRQWYRYQINWYRYPKVDEHQYTFGTGTALTGTGTNMQSLRDLSRIPILVQGYARLSTTTWRSLRRMTFKPIEGQRRAVFYSRVWFWMVGVSLSYFARVYKLQYLSFLRILSFQLLVIFQLVHTTWYFLTGFCAFDIPILQLKCYFSSHIYA